MQRLSFRLIGTHALLQHNERLANPLNEHAKRLSALASKRKKTEADLLDLARVEFEGGLYFDDEDGPYLPSHMIDKALLESAKREKLGQQFKSYVMCDIDRMPILNGDPQGKKYPREIEAMWKAGFYDQRMVRVQQSKTLRTRPMFPAGWSVVAPVVYDENAIDKAQLVRCMERAGAAIGIGDFRPRFGRFAVEVIR